MQIIYNAISLSYTAIFTLAPAAQNNYALKMKGKNLGQYMILPETGYPAERNRYNQSIGRNTPLSTEIATPLLDIGLVHGLITKRRDYTYQKKRIEWRHTLILLLDGRMELELNGKMYHPAPGQLSYYPAGTMVFQSNPGESWFIWLDFKNNDHWDPLMKYGAYVRDYEAADLMYLLMEHIASAYANPEKEAIRMARQKAGMLANLVRHEIRRVSQRPGKHDLSLQTLLEEIRANPNDQWTVTEMAQRLNISIRTLNRIFHKQFGITPIDMVIRERMAAAHAMLEETDTTVAAVARELGYESTTSFCRLFKKYTGKAPRECRESYL